MESAEGGLEEVAAVLGVCESAGCHDTVDKVGGKVCGWIVCGVSERIVDDFGVVPDASQPTSGLGGLI